MWEIIYNNQNWQNRSGCEIVMVLGELNKILANCFCIILHMVIKTVGACFPVPTEGLEDDR